MSRKRKEAEIDWSCVLCDLASDVSADEQRLLEAAIFQHSKRAIRLHPERSVDSLPFATESVPWSDQGRFLVDAKQRPGAFLEFAGGDYYIQDAGSLLPITLAGIKPGERVCDVCAAPGGKSTATLEQLRGTGCLVSNEVIRSRVDVLSLALAKSGYSNYGVSNLSADELADAGEEWFDCVIVDAPCTGQSMLARDKQSLAAFSSRQIEHSAARQQTILRDAIRLVRPGGRLVYSTCTFAFAENEAIVEWLCKEFSDLEVIESPALAAWQSPRWPGCYRLWPHRDGCSGGFAAAVRKRDDGASGASGVSGAADRARNDLARSGRYALSRKELWQAVDDERELAETLGTFGEGKLGRYWLRGNELHLLPSELPESLRLAVLSGSVIAEQTGSVWQPAYASACLRSNDDFVASQSAELTDGHALRFMSGESLQVEGSNGWCRVLWRERSLAWGKYSAGQLKNHLPKGLRGHFTSYGSIVAPN